MADFWTVRGSVSVSGVRGQSTSVQRAAFVPGGTYGEAARGIRNGGEVCPSSTVLAHAGEQAYVHDSELSRSLWQHLSECDDCSRYWEEELAPQIEQDTEFIEQLELEDESTAPVVDALCDSGALASVEIPEWNVSKLRRRSKEVWLHCVRQLLETRRRATAIADKIPWGRYRAPAGIVDAVLSCVSGRLETALGDVASVSSVQTLPGAGVEDPTLRDLFSSELEIEDVSERSLSDVKAAVGSADHDAHGTCSHCGHPIHVDAEICGRFSGRRLADEDVVEYAVACPNANCHRVALVRREHRISDEECLLALAAVEPSELRAFALWYTESVSEIEKSEELPRFDDAEAETRCTSCHSTTLRMDPGEKEAVAELQAGGRYPALGTCRGCKSRQAVVVQLDESGALHWEPVGLQINDVQQK